MLLRLVELFAKRGIVPRRVVAVVEPDGTELTIDLQVDLVASADAAALSQSALQGSGLMVNDIDHMAAAMRAIPFVRSVLVAAPADG
ncbi:MAG: hypothetical protein JNK11_18455 [Alphaproteobacteria bacterium]|nr:hypothetical protein [Alphaproteobacteria bacterium]